MVTTVSTSDPLVGQLLDGRYAILRKLARGGMATVYLADDQRLTRTVAIKVMHEGLGDDQDFIGAFDREARAALIDDLADRSGAAVVQRIGHTAVLYRTSTEKRRFVLPRA